MTATSVASIDRPLAAVLSPDGKTVYMTAHDANGLAQLYSVPASGGAPTLISTSTPLFHPLALAISPDGSKLFIGDSAGGAEDAGVVYAGDTSGAIGTGSGAFTGVRAPAGIAVSADGTTVYVTGFDAADGQPGVFQGDIGGGALRAVAKGPPFNNPSGVAVTDGGTVLVVDAVALGVRKAAVLKVVGNTASPITQDELSVGFPAGISPLTFGSSDMLVTGNNGLGSGVIYQVSATGTATALTLNMPMFDPATIHHAAKANVWVTVDSINATQAAPGQQLGQVFVLNP